MGKCAEGREREGEKQWLLCTLSMKAYVKCACFLHVMGIHLCVCVWGVCPCVVCVWICVWCVWGW